MNNKVWGWLMQLDAAYGAGLLLCSDSYSVVVESVLRSSRAPLGVSGGIRALVRLLCGYELGR
jgi:hypothetical protein